MQNSTKKSPCIYMMAGGTGGHIFPGLAVAHALQQQQIAVRWLGSRRGLENQLIPPTGIPLDLLPVVGLRGNGAAGWLKAPGMIYQAITAARDLFRKHQPCAVIGMGGFASGPGGIAAKCCGIPLFIHEQNAVAGLTNKILARLTPHVYSAFPNVLPHTQQLGNPVRKEIEHLSAPQIRFASRDTAEPLRILLLGGSQGAQFLNQLFPQAVALLPFSVEIWHQTGKNQLESTRNAYGDNMPFRLAEFITDMAEAYGWADLVISRAGALTIFELAAAGVGSLLVPLPTAVDDHQTYNAAFLAEHGAAKILPQGTLTPEILAAQIDQLHSRTILLQMAQAARNVAQAQTAQQLANQVIAAAISN